MHIYSFIGKTLGIWIVLSILFACGSTPLTFGQQQQQQLEEQKKQTVALQIQTIFVGIGVAVAATAIVVVVLVRRKKGGSVS